MLNKTLKIAIASGKGGVGKSMLASSLALLFGKHYTTIALDCDVDAPNLNLWLGQTNEWQEIQKISISEKPIIDTKKCIGCGKCIQACRFSALRLVNKKSKLIPFLCEGCGLCEIVCPQKAIELKPVKNGEVKFKQINQKLKLFSGQLYPGETGSGKIVDAIKAKAEKHKAQIIIIDSAPGTGCPVIASLQNTDYTILVTEPTPSSLTDLERVLKIIKHFQIPYQIIINKWDINKVFSEIIKQKFKNNFLGKISYDQKIFQSISNLKPILKTNLKSKKEIIKIFKEINLWLGL